MRNASPLRYPGGKSALSGVLAKIRNLNELGNRSIAEPFAGGAGASLSLLYLEEANHIYINDADPAIHDFWWSLLNRSQGFLKMLSKKRASMAEWHRQRDEYRCRQGISRLRRGFATFYLNRCNRSGIIMNGGPIGGLDQTGQWKIGARYNKSDLQHRCEKIVEYRERINVSPLDGIQFIETMNAAETFFFIDPPYFEKGQTLYLNAANDRYHAELADQLHDMRNDAWALTYDDCAEIRRLYRGWANIRPFKLRYVASTRRKGSEILITPCWMRVPKSQESSAINW
jgi:DNA adenine methylase